MSRREALLALLAIGFASATPRALAQPVARMRRIGFITLRSGPNEYDAAFRDALRSLGYVEGRTIRIDYRWAAGNEKRADELVADLLAQNVEVIVAATAPAIRAAMRATKRIPIVMAATADPVSSGLVASLARPGGNVTGLSLVSPDTAAKRLQLLQELIPSATRIGVLLMNTGVAREFDALIGQLEPAAQRLGLRLSMAAVRSGGEIDAALATMQRDRTHALIVAATPVSIDNRKLIAELAARHRLPAMYEVDGFVEAGGLVSYGPSLADMYKRAAIYVDKILKGAKPADLPVELPIKYDLAINLTAAKALGLQLPQTLIVRADRVIE
jgi:putative ABC transport system substrate-binding protein